jgi:hypothetical protein
MIIKIKRKRLKQAGFVLISTLIVVVAMLGVSMTTNSVIGANQTNQTVIARVNVSNTEPNLYKVEIRVNGTSAPPIDLTPGAATVVICNGSFQDINGFDDIATVNATFYDISVASDAADDNNTHYTNTSCETLTDCQVIPDSNNQNGSCLCQFAVQYYANPVSWQCNMTITDSGGLESNENSSFITINEVLGIDVESTTIDFGNISVTQTSEPIRQNVTNVGNIPINLTVRGFGGSNDSIDHPGHNLSMICDPSAGATANISFNNMRFDVNNRSQNVYGDMTNITNQTSQIANLTIPKRTTNSGFGNSSNSTFWRLQIPLGAAGICNGTIIFGAIDATLT